MKQENETKKMMDEPKIGQVVVTYANYIYGVKFGVQQGTYTFSLKDIDQSDAIGDPALLLKYEGNGIFTEYYTQQKLLFAIDFDPSEWNLEKYSDFAIKNNYFNYRTSKDIETNIELINKFKAYPLIIKKFWDYIKDEDKELLADQDENTIRTGLNELFSQYKNQFYESLASVYQYDKKIALADNMIYDFEHGISRKLVKKDEDAKENAN